MERIDPELVEREMVALIQETCEALNIEMKVDNSFCPGRYIKSQVLIDIISSVEELLEIEIPLDCYIFISKERKQLSIHEAVQKVIKVAKRNGREYSNV